MAKHYTIFNDARFTYPKKVRIDLLIPPPLTNFAKSPTCDDRCRARFVSSRENNNKKGIS